MRLPYLLFRRAILSSPSTIAALLLAAVVGALAWRWAGPGGLLYLLIYTATALPGLPLGFALFGRRHAAGWIAGTLCGYALTSLALWLPVEFGRADGTWASLAWGSLSAVTWWALRSREPLVALPAWQRRDTLALILVAMVVPVLVARPFSRIGERDEAGHLRYRAYFTADFLWHVALTAELAKGEDDPRNPYLARRPLHYYWAYFVVPSTVARTTALLPSIAAGLKVNALCAGLVFASALFVFAWCAVPRAGTAAIGVLLAVLAASAEGLYAVLQTATRAQPLQSLRHVNIDAITSWFFQSLSIDGLPRAIWYTPQHAASCGLALIALLVAGHGGVSVRARTALFAGTALGLAVVFSPFLGGAFSVVYGLTAAWNAWGSTPRSGRALWAHTAAAVPVLMAFGWCLANRTFDGAGGSIALGLSRRAAAAPLATPVLALGPVLGVAVAGFFAPHPVRSALRPAFVALVVGLVMFYGVTLRVEPIWIGWRAGQIILVTIPALVGAGVAALTRVGYPRTTLVVIAIAFSIGTPTTLIDWHNAQDVENLEEGPGFRWTVRVPPDSQAALTWIREHTPEDAVVQMSIEPRGRETWTLVPTFAERRLAAGEPISLLQIPEYAQDSARLDSIFSTPAADEAWKVARAFRVDYIYVDEVERRAFGAALEKFGDPRYFGEVFRQGLAAVYQVRLPY